MKCIPGKIMFSETRGGSEEFPDTQKRVCIWRVLLLFSGPLPEFSQSSRYQELEVEWIDKIFCKRICKEDQRQKMVYRPFSFDYGRIFMRYQKFQVYSSSSDDNTCTNGYHRRRIRVYTRKKNSNRCQPIRFTRICDRLKENSKIEGLAA